MSIALALLFWSFRIREHAGTPIDTTPDMDDAVAHLPSFAVDFVLRADARTIDGDVNRAHIYICLCSHFDLDA